MSGNPEAKFTLQSLYIKAPFFPPVENRLKHYLLSDMESTFWYQSSERMSETPVQDERVFWIPLLGLSAMHTRGRRAERGWKDRGLSIALKDKWTETLSHQEVYISILIMCFHA